MLKQQKGMTLTILVLSIVAVLALAAISIAMVLDELSYDPETVQVNTEQQTLNTDATNTQETIQASEQVEQEIETPATTVQESNE